MTFGERLKSMRKEKKMTQAALAEKSGISSNTIFSFESGRRKNPTSDTIFKLASALNVDPGELVADWPGLKIIDRGNPVAPEQGNKFPPSSESSREHLCHMIDTMDEDEIDDVSSILGAYTGSNENGRKSLTQHAWEVKQIADYRFTEDHDDK